jgi:thioredoxin-related protein
MDKKNIFSTIILILLVVVVAVLMLLSNNSNGKNKDTNSADGNVLKTFLIDKDGKIPTQNCGAGHIEKKIIVIESKYCSACKEFLKVIEKVNETSQYIFHIYDVSESDQREFIENTLKIDFQYTPTMIVGCDAYIGYKDENTLLSILSKYDLEKQEPL